MSLSPPATLTPLSAEVVLGKTPSLKEPALLDGALYWLEQRPHEQGRTTLMGRAAQGQEPRECTPGDWNLRCRVHEYGGGPCAIGRRANGEAVAVFVHDADRCLWRLDLDQPGAEPQRLLNPQEKRFEGALGGGLIDRQRDRWIGVLERDGQDRLVALPLAGGELVALHQAADFCGYPALSPNGARLAWVEWQQPAMPWDCSSLWLADVEASGQLGPGRRVAGSAPEDAEAISVFQPIWAERDLVVANDRSGFWNLERWSAAEQDALETPRWQPLQNEQAEFAMPQWVFGMSTHAWDGERLLALACRQGRWELGELKDQSWRPLEQPCSDLAGLCAQAGQLACIASSPTLPSGLLEFDLKTGSWRHQPAAPCPIAQEAISQPQELWFDGHGGQATQAWYYPPTGGGHSEAPLLVKSHSGPTAMARTGLNLAIQFWTSRGWWVVDVNYGGSTGFGRAYRERLNGQWGVVDVADCAAAAQALIEQGQAHPKRVAIEGGSAGGFTTLAALCFTDCFSAGASRYGVADLSALAEDTHRFEARYLDGLVGPWPEQRALYAARSPLNHAERMSCPVIFFQGLEDVVVPPEQTERMAEALRHKGIPVEVRLFPEEGHGFRKGSTQIEVLEATEAFFRAHFAL